MPRADALPSANGLGWRVPLRQGAHLRRADGRALAEDRQEQGSNTEVPSSQPARSGVPIGSGGARAGRSAGISVGRPRCRRIRSITAASSMSAIKRSRPATPGTRQHVKPKCARDWAKREQAPFTIRGIARNGNLRSLRSGRGRETPNREHCIPGGRDG